MRAIDIGAWGEEQAVKFLEEKGYAVRCRNFKCREGELDIVANKNGTTVFVEVKTRKSELFGRPAEFVDYRKQRRIIKAAMRYTYSPDIDMRFDVIEIIYNDNGTELSIKEINHIENAFWVM